MPEGPEVRRHADTLAAALTPHPLVSLTARTKAARAWLAERPGLLEGRRVESVRSRGKNLVGLIEGGYYFYSHLMMWGRWHVFAGDAPLETDKRERARIVVPESVAILFSAPVFEIGEGDPMREVEFLRQLGPDTLPLPGEGPFDAACFQARLLAPPHRERTIGAALLDQTILAGIGNYLRAEILFACRMDPWRLVRDLSPNDLDCLSGTIPAVVARAYATGGVTVPDEVQVRMRTGPGLTYNPESEWGTRHWVFRRTNLPCLVCGGPIRQKRQMTRQDEDGEKERITYFCPVCQGTSVPLPAVKRKAPTPHPSLYPATEALRLGAASGRGGPDRKSFSDTPLPLAGEGSARSGGGGGQ